MFWGRPSPEPEPLRCLPLPLLRGHPQAVLKLLEMLFDHGVIAHDEIMMTAFDQAAAINFRIPNEFDALMRLKASIDSAASAFTLRKPRVRNRPPADIRLIVPNGCSTVQRRIVIRLGSAFMRPSILSRAPWSMSRWIVR